MADEFTEEEWEALEKLQAQIQKEMRQRDKKRMPIDCVTCWKGARELNRK